MFKFPTTLLLLPVLVLPILAKTAQYGSYNFTFFVEENCEGPTNGEPMTGEVGDGVYCMNFTQGGALYAGRVCEPHGQAWGCH